MRAQHRSRIAKVFLSPNRINHLHVVAKIAIRIPLALSSRRSARSFVVRKLARDLLWLGGDAVANAAIVVGTGSGAMVKLEDAKIEAERSGIDLAVAAIERYVAAHPAAADNAQGVAQWWLPAIGVDLPVEVVHRALEWMSNEGALTRSVLPDGGTVYRSAQRDSAPRPSDAIGASANQIHGDDAMRGDERQDRTE